MPHTSGSPWDSCRSSIPAPSPPGPWDQHPGSQALGPWDPSRPAPRHPAYRVHSTQLPGSVGPAFQLPAHWVRGTLLEQHPSAQLLWPQHSPSPKCHPPHGTCCDSSHRPVEGWVCGWHQLRHSQIVPSNQGALDPLHSPTAPRSAASTARAHPTASCKPCTAPGHGSALGMPTPLVVSPAPRAPTVHASHVWVPNGP